MLAFALILEIAQGLFGNPILLAESDCQQVVVLDPLADGRRLDPQDGRRAFDVQQDLAEDFLRVLIGLAATPLDLAGAPLRRVHPVPPYALGSGRMVAI